MYMRKRDILKEKFGATNTINTAQHLLEKEDQSEEEFLGAKLIMMLAGKMPTQEHFNEI